MKNAKRLAALFLTAAVLLTAGCSRKTVTSQNSVWFIAKSTNTEFWKSAFAGANAAKSEYNVDLTICGPETEEDYEEQNRLIDEAVAAGADAIVYSAISYTKNAEAITRAAKQGLKIAVIDSDVDSDGVGVRIGTDNVEAGRMAGRAALQTDWDVACAEARAAEARLDDRAGLEQLCRRAVARERKRNGDVFYVRIDKNRKLPITCLIRALGVDIDVETCGEITPLSTLDYLIGSFDSDIITLDYRVRGFTRDVSGKKLFIDHDITSIQDYIDAKILARYDAIDINVYQANLFHTNMLIKELDLQNYLFNVDANELPPQTRLDISSSLRREMIEIFSGRNIY